ncbi:MAG: phosphate acyltransferase [Syntrophales bacterium]|nr:phosphate acyltransferase [Syntrophales bacterium]
MINSLEDISVLAQKRGPKKLAVLAPEDAEFMNAVKIGWEKGYIEPILIGDIKKMEDVARKVAFNIDKFMKIPQTGQQAISDLGIGKLFSGNLPIVSKGQIPTSHIYRSIIREEAKAGSGMTVSVISFWDIPGIDHLVAFTDTGVTIKPNVKAKAEIIKNAVFVYRLLGHPRPRIAVLSGQREVGGVLDSYKDYEALKRSADSGDFGECELVSATSFTGIFLGENNYRGGDMPVKGDEVPHILVVPCLDTGNVLCKLDFFLDVTRSSLVATSKGPVCIPARSDFSDNIVQQLAMSVVLADEMEKDEH